MSKFEYKSRREPSSVILVEPEFFQIVDEKNPYMENILGEIDRDLAWEQWQHLKSIYEQLAAEGYLDKVTVIPGAKGLEDMVFCANQSLPWMDGGKKRVLMSNMRHDSRQREVPHFTEFYERNGYTVSKGSPDHYLEGMGDCIFHPFTALIWMGYGYRTSEAAKFTLEQEMGMPVKSLKLVSKYFYHLDTCFLPIDDKQVLLCEEAFDETSLEKILSVFEEVIPVSRREAIDTFCLNTHCIYHRDRPVAVTPAGDHTVKRELSARGYRVIEANTSEFIKSGGSVFCMKMMYYD